MHKRNNKDWIQTFTGKRFNLFDPKPKDVDILDIAHALGNLCRYTGHCKRFYSVAEHSIFVSMRAEELAGRDTTAGVRAARWGLLHDASEAYVNDLARPLKHQPELKLYRRVEQRVMGVIAAAFQLGKEPACVKQADDELLWTEVRDLLQPLHPDWKKTARKVVEPLEGVRCIGFSPDKASYLFMARFKEVFGA
jgi:uncharacterized protein